jgi:benzoylformate decarboxylase
VQLAEPGRPVIGVIGDGSANYAITGLWSAAHYRVPTTFVILRNDEYGVLKWFAGALKATDLPDMDLPGIDYCSIAQGYGVRAVRIASRDELSAALVRSVASDSPSLIEVPIRAVGQGRPNNRMQATAGGLGCGIGRDGRAPAAPDAER